MGVLGFSGEFTPLDVPGEVVPYESLRDLGPGRGRGELEEGRETEAELERPAASPPCLTSTGGGGADPEEPGVKVVALPRFVGCCGLFSGAHSAPFAPVARGELV